MLSESNYKRNINFLIGCSYSICILFCSCNNDDAELPPSYKITGFYAQPVQITRWDSLSGMADFIPLEINAINSTQLFGLSFKSKISLVAGKKYGNKYNSRLVENLPPDQALSADSISEISVYSDRDFDEEHKAGDNLNDKFLILFRSPDNDHKLTAVPLNEYLKKPQSGRSSFTLLLKENPKTSHQHKFTVHYRKEDNALYVITFTRVSFESELSSHPMVAVRPYILTK